LVDALRFEMARELTELLDKRWNADLQVALSTPPTITDVGMAALMPGAQMGVSLESPVEGKLKVTVAGRHLGGRDDRVAHFKANISGVCAETTLDQLAPLTKSTLRQQLAKAEVILVTATDEIDGLWERNPSLARRMMDDALNQLRRGINTLFGLGVEQIILTADHGYLFGERISAGDSIDAPGGHTAVLKRRVWVGKGGSSHAGLLRKPLSAFGVGGDLELVTPYNFACFKVAGGSMEYFHGGLSLPELAVPVLVLSAKQKAMPADGVQAKWEIALGSRTISTRFVSVTVEGSSDGLLGVTQQKLRVEIRAAGEVISVPVSASYGFDESSKDTLMKPKADMPQMYAPNTVTLMLTVVPSAQTAIVCLLDADTGRILQQSDPVPLSVAL